MFPVLYFLSYVFVFIIDVFLYRMMRRRFLAKRRFLIPFLVASILWPIIDGFWWVSIGGSSSPAAHHEGYIKRQGFWYAFDTHYPLANFMYYHLNSMELPALLALIDVLILGTIICIPIYLITLLRRWWVK